jgi:hypothetical protein
MMAMETFGTRIQVIQIRLLLMKAILVQLFFTMQLVLMIG